jgi:hypothetical protein
VGDLVKEDVLRRRRRRIRGSLIPEKEEEEFSQLNRIVRSETCKND